MTEAQTALALVVAIQIAGACPDVPEVRGLATWLLRWAHDAMQAVARNKDKMP